MTERRIANLLVKHGEWHFAERRKVNAFTETPDADRLLNDLRNYPHAFVLGCIMDRQIKAEKAWLIPYRFSEKLGGFEFTKLRKLSLSEIKKFMKKKKLHRFRNEMSVNFHDAVRLIDRRYAGDASRIWKGRPSSEEVIYRFREFRGVGPKIANMAANILARHFKVRFADYSSIDISVDVHVRRVFARLRLVSEDASNDQIIFRARSLHSVFPGILDFPAWEIGKKWCEPEEPLCAECYMNKLCPTARFRIAQSRTLRSKKAVT